MKIELLAPAGNFESLMAAVESGADAVYIGGTKFSARAFADNFDEDSIVKAVKYCHIRNVKVYVTINILLTDEELTEALEYVQFLYNNDVDAIIVQDIGLLYWIKRHFPDMPVHCSTQMTIHNKDGVVILTQLGADRFVLAREMNIKEISSLIEDADAEVEIFVHGALCVCYSGQCLMSSFIGGRSGNRGKCAQPCRKAYALVDLESGKPDNSKNRGYLLSPKDLNTIEFLDQIVKSGVKSLKIEGRMKKPEYVAIVVKHYRDMLDLALQEKNSQISEDIKTELESAFNRGFTRGFLFNEKKYEFVNRVKPNNRGVFIGKVLWQKGSKTAITVEKGVLNKGDGIEIILADGTSIGTYITSYEKHSNDVIIVNLKQKLVPGLNVYKTYDKALHEKAHREYFYENKRKVYLEAEIYIRKGKRILFKVWDYDGHSLQLESECIAEEAEKLAITEDRVVSQLKKTGDTPYIFNNINVHMDDDIFVSMSVLNDIRREALKKLDEILALRHKREWSSLSRKDFMVDIKQEKHSDNNKLYFGATVMAYDNVKPAIESGVDYIYYGTTDRVNEAVVSCHNSNIEIYFYLPNIIKDSEKNKYARIIEENEFDGIVISNISQLSFADIKPELKIAGNYNLNVFNMRSMDVYLKLGTQIICPSIELNLKQLKSIAHTYGSFMELVVYGQLPLMTMEYCPISSEIGCKGCKMQRRYGLKDAKGAVFPIFCNEYKTQLLNSNILFVAEEMDKIVDTGVKRVRLDFYRENAKNVREIIELYKNYKNLDQGKHIDIINRIKNAGYTKGHYFRGVD